MAARVVAAEKGEADDGVGLMPLPVDGLVEAAAWLRDYARLSARSAVQIAEISLHQADVAFGISGVDDVGHHLAGRIIAFKKLSAVGSGERTDALGRTEYVVGKRRTGEYPLLEFVEDRIGRRVEV